MSAKALRLIVALGLMLPSLGMAFNSGSTGVDGDFKPTANVKLPLPPSGVFNFKSVNIPTNVTVTFTRNTANTPVYMLVQTDATIAGTIDVSGQNSPDTGSAGDGDLANDGMPGQSGPGGFDGGAGGYPVSPAIGLSRRGGDGQGPGGGMGNSACGIYGNNGAFGGGFVSKGGEMYSCTGGGNIYGNFQLQPLIGGSGGGGAGGTDNYIRGIGGGGGGGAILIAASGTINLNGKFLSNGGNSGSHAGYSGSIGGGGGGSGGAIRIIASVLKGNGQITANGGVGWGERGSGKGSVGRIRIEAESNFLATISSPVSINTNTPGLIFIPSHPSLAIASVAGVVLGVNSEVSVPASTTNPVNVVINATGIPIDTLVALTAKPENDAAIVAAPSALVGTVENSSATLQVDLPVGASILEASTTFVITASLGDKLAPYAGNERVEKITLVATTGGQSETRLITVSGKTYPAPKGVWGIGG
jgi:hypothetical protein